MNRGDRREPIFRSWARSLSGSQPSSRAFPLQELAGRTDCQAIKGIGS
jgi:hypothetical protein